jgi:molecular chaperone DnaJ
VVHKGGEHEINVSHPVTCDRCHGYGTHDGRQPRLCPECNGSGRKVAVSKESRQGQTVQVQRITICPVCHGKGTQVDKPCSACGGYGKIEKQETLKVKIPPGIEDGMVLRVKGHGLPAEQPGLPSGDLHASVYAQADPRFQRRGADLWRSETIDAMDAILGREIDVPTLGGKVKVKIPPGTQPDEILRLKGKGLRRYNSTAVGDLNLRIVIHIPQDLDDESRQKLTDIRNRLKRGA